MPQGIKLHELSPLMRIHAINRLALLGRINRDAAKALVDLAKVEMDANKAQDEADFLNARRSGRLSYYQPADRYAGLAVGQQLDALKERVASDPALRDYLLAERETLLNNMGEGHDKAGK